MGILSVISTIWHVVVTFTLVILLSAVAPTHQSANYVFTSLNVPDVGIDNHGYIFFLGLLMSQFCITGVQTIAHVLPLPAQTVDCTPS